MIQGALSVINVGLSNFSLNYQNSLVCGYFLRPGEGAKVHLKCLACYWAIFLIDGKFLFMNISTQACITLSTGQIKKGDLT